MESLEKHICNKGWSQDQRLLGFIEYIKDYRLPLDEDLREDAIVIGIASGWSDEDVKLFDKFISSNKIERAKVYAFDYLQATSRDWFNQRFGCAEKIFQSPFLKHNGKCYHGHAARERIVRLLSYN